MSRKNKRTKSNSQYLILGAVGGIIFLVLAVIAWQFMLQGQAAPKAISRLTTRDFHSLAFSPTEAETVFFGHHGGLMISHDSGKSWQAGSFPNADAMALAVPAANPQIMYAAGHEVFYKSADGGKTWQTVKTNLPGLDIHGFVVDPQNAETVYANVVGFGIFGSRDGGQTWTLISTNAPRSTFNLVMGENGQTLYAAAANAGLWRSGDSGHTWSRVADTPDTGVIALTYVTSKKQLFITTFSEKEGGVYRSDDEGKTWIALGLQGTILAIAYHPQDVNRLIAIDDSGWVYLSRDGGQNWGN